MIMCLLKLDLKLSSVNFVCQNFVKYSENL